MEIEEIALPIYVALIQQDGNKVEPSERALAHYTKLAFAYAEAFANAADDYNSR